MALKASTTNIYIQNEESILSELRCKVYSLQIDFKIKNLYTKLKNRLVNRAKNVSYISNNKTCLHNWPHLLT